MSDVQPSRIESAAQIGSFDSDEDAGVTGDPIEDEHRVTFACCGWVPIGISTAATFKGPFPRRTCCRQACCALPAVPFKKQWICLYI